MKVTQEKLPASQIGLEIEISPEMSTRAYEKTLAEFTRNANIPGFRKGKVPRKVLIQRFGSSRIKAAAVEELVQNSLKKALEQENIDAIGNFELRSSFEELISQFEPGTTFTFSAVVDIPPQVTLSQYTGLQVQAEEVKYDPDRVDKLLEDYRKRSATLVPVEGRSAQFEDVVTVDFKGRFAPEAGADDEAAEEIPGGSAEDFEIELTEGRFIPGFIDGIIGMNPGEMKDVAVTFPDDYPQQELAGKSAIFAITLKELKEREFPDLDDDFAQEISQFETLAELRESLESRFREEADEKTKQNKHEALLNELVKHIEVELPETLLKREIEYSIAQTAVRLEQQGMDIKKVFTDEVVSVLRQQARPEAIARLQRTLALGEVAEQESIQVEPEALTAKVEEIVENYPDNDVDINRLREVVGEDLLREKILSWLEEHGAVELVPEGSLSKAEPELSPSPDGVIGEENIEDIFVGESVDAAFETVETTVEVIAEPVDEVGEVNEVDEAE
ncbi:MAG: trigger factor [Cyanobacteria bacterium CRU_2_1]|nr:trigger factor [Cyanobacteria bacterium RU_5_0]NJR58548.1 trigger factor [Cyanobacteria bacterium CRU_2_1]